MAQIPGALQQGIGVDTCIEIAGAEGPAVVSLGQGIDGGQALRHLITHILRALLLAIVGDGYAVDGHVIAVGGTVQGRGQPRGTHMDAQQHDGHYNQNGCNYGYRILFAPPSGGGSASESAIGLLGSGPALFIREPALCIRGSAARGLSSTAVRTPVFSTAFIGRVAAALCGGTAGCARTSGGRSASAAIVGIVIRLVIHVDITLHTQLLSIITHAPAF